MSKEELLKYLIAVIDLIMHDKDYRFENQDGTWYSRESCRDLTNEEVFEELKSELRQLADLEAKLAESDLRIEELESKFAYECECNKQFVECQNENEMLKQQLTASEERAERHKVWYNEKAGECAELKQQLADKEKEIKKLKTLIDAIDKYGQYDKDVENLVLFNPENCYSNGHKLIIKADKQDKISFAVEQLIQAKECIKKSLEYMWNSNAEMTCRDRNIIDGIYTELDEQIEELTHHQKDKGE